MNETKQMISSIVDWNASRPDNRIIISVELENHSKNNVNLLENADVVFLSKDYSQFMGWNEKEVALETIRSFAANRYFRDMLALKNFLE